MTSAWALEGQQEDSQRPENEPSRQGEQPELSLCITSIQIASTKYGMRKGRGVRPEERTMPRSGLRSGSLGGNTLLCTRHYIHHLT